MAFNNNSITIDIESWFIPIDIIKIISDIFAIILALIFLFIIIFDKTCHTVPMMLVTNSYLVQLVYAGDVLIMDLLTLQNDLKQIQFYNFLCMLSAAVAYMITMVQMYSYFLQAIYRYITVVYPSRLIWQSARLQAILIGLTWIVSTIYVIPILLTHQIPYDIDDQICQMPLHLSFLTIFNVLNVYICPLGGIIFVYYKMVVYVKAMGKRITPVNVLARAQRELRMSRRIVTLVFMLLFFGIPYTLFILMSFFNHVPKYHFRIAFIFIDLSLGFMMIALFQIAEPLKASVRRKFKRGTIAVVPTVT